MILRLRHIENEINIELGRPVVIDVVPSRLFGSYVFQIQKEVETGEESDDFFISNAGKRVSLKNVPFISSPYGYDFHSKMIIHALHKRIQNELLYSGEHEEEVRRAYQTLIGKIENILLEINVETRIDGSLDLQKLLKFFNVDVGYSVSPSALENITNFIEIYSMLLPETPIFLLNQICFLSEEDIKCVTETIENCNSLTIFLESGSVERKASGVFIEIDKDYDCLINS